MRFGTIIFFQAPNFNSHSQSGASFTDRVLIQDSDGPDTAYYGYFASTTIWVWRVEEGVDGSDFDSAIERNSAITVTQSPTTYNRTLDEYETQNGVTTRATTEFEWIADQELVVSSSEYPDWPATPKLTTDYTYYSSGRIRSMAEPSGGWIAYSYAIEGNATNGYYHVEKNWSPFETGSMPDPLPTDNGGTGVRLTKTFYHRGLQRGDLTAYKTERYIEGNLAGRTEYRHAGSHPDLYDEITIDYSASDEALITRRRYYRLNDTSFPYWQQGKIAQVDGPNFFSGTIPTGDWDTNLTKRRTYTYEESKLAGSPPGWSASIFGSDKCYVTKIFEFPQESNKSTYQEIIEDAEGRTLRTMTKIHGVGGSSGIVSSASYDYAFDESTGTLTTETWSGDYAQPISTVTRSALQSQTVDNFGVTTTTYYDGGGNVVRTVRDAFTASDYNGNSSTVPAQETFYARSIVSNNRFKEEMRVGPPNNPSPGNDPTGPTTYVSSYTITDMNGREVEGKDENGYITSYSYDTAARETTTTRPDGQKVITKLYKDGTTNHIISDSTTPDAVVRRYFDYSVGTDGRVTLNTCQNVFPSSCWTEEVSDWLGRVVETRRPGVPNHNGSGNHPDLVQVITYDSALSGAYGFPGSMAKTQTGTLAPKYYKYDARGVLTEEGLDLDGTAGLATSSATHPDQITTYTTDYWEDTNSVRWLRTVTSDGATSQTTLNRNVASTAGVFSIEKQTIGGRTVTTTSKIASGSNPFLESVVEDTSSDVVSRSGSLGGYELFELSQAPGIATNVDVAKVVSTYDAYDRITHTEETRKGIVSDVTWTYEDGGTEKTKRLDKKVAATPGAYTIEEEWVYGTQNSLGAGEVKTYIERGKNGTTTLRTLSTSYGYDTVGRLANMSGATYPVRYCYDSYGRLEYMHTYRSSWNFSDDNSGDKTQWIRDVPTGVLLKKKDASGQEVEYKYDANGLLHSRTWARNVTTTYTYTPAGQVETVTYSDGSIPVRTFRYDAQGRVDEVIGGGQEATLGYDPGSGQLTQEDWGTGPLDGFVLNKTYDETRPDLISIDHTSSGKTVSYQDFDWRVQYGMPSGVAGSTPSNLVSYGVDAFGRRESVDFYDSPGTSAYLTINRLYAAGRYGDAELTSISTTSHDGSVNVSRYVERRNGLRQRERVGKEGGPFWLYEYDSKGQVVEAFRCTPPATPGSNVIDLAGQQYLYYYDNAGNRSSTRTGGNPDSQGVFNPYAVPAKYYSRNAVNEYTSITDPGKCNVFGTAANASDTVLVDGLSIASNDRQHPFWRKELSDTGPKRRDIDVKVNGTTVETGECYFPNGSFAPNYDGDGNLIEDWRWYYKWDAENRLQKMMSKSFSGMTADTHRLIEFTYDWQGRRIQKIVYKANTNTPDGLPALNMSQWTELRKEFYVYDGWNLMHRWIDEASGTDHGQSYVWGLDVADSISATGGIGALHVIEELDSNRAISDTHAVVHDLRGNVILLASPALPMDITAEYDYGAFGEVHRRTGPMAKKNPFQFSTKFTDEESGLNYYGYRYYEPNTGRWLSRDPIGERGGLNLYGFVGNDPVNSIDYLGLATQAYFVFNPTLEKGYVGSTRGAKSKAINRIKGNHPTKGWRTHRDTLVFVKNIELDRDWFKRGRKNKEWSCDTKDSILNKLVRAAESDELADRIDQFPTLKFINDGKSVDEKIQKILSDENYEIAKRHNKFKLTGVVEVYSVKRSWWRRNRLVKSSNSTAVNQIRRGGANQFLGILLLYVNTKNISKAAKKDLDDLVDSVESGNGDQVLGDGAAFVDSLELPFGEAGAAGAVVDLADNVDQWGQ